jgi:hypothetical protein
MKSEINYTSERNLCLFVAKFSFIIKFCNNNYFLFYFDHYVSYWYFSFASICISLLKCDFV